MGAVGVAQAFGFVLTALNSRIWISFDWRSISIDNGT